MVLDKRKSMYYIYALFSLKDRKLYIGFTHNVDARVKEHNSGKVPSTQTRRPLKLIYYEMHLSKKDALRRERYFKTTKGRTTIKQMLRNSMPNA